MYNVYSITVTGQSGE